MKILILTVILNSSNLFAGEGGGGGGGVVPSGEMLLSINPHEKFYLKEVDNIELGYQIQYPESLQEKIELLKRENVQSVQLTNGAIILNK